MTLPVQVPGQSTWCTVADVQLYTGIAIDQAALSVANATLELHAGRTYFELVSNPDGGVVKIGRRDLQWMRQACAYQAAWIAGQPDLFTRLDVNMLASTGRPIALKDRALVLAPLARRALQRVSWLRSRSLHTRSSFEDGMGGINPNPDSEGNDEFETWSGFGT